VVDLGVQVVRRADVDDVDIFSLEQLPPVGLDRFVAPLVGKGLRLGRVTGANGLEHRLLRQVEEMADELIRGRVRPAHEAVADHANVESLRHGSLLVEGEAPRTKIQITKKLQEAKSKSKRRVSRS